MSEIELDLRTHCIETAVNRCYDRLLSEYFRSKEDDTESEEKLVLLLKALSAFDFPSLRSAYRELAGNSSACIVLSDTGDSLPSIIIDGHPVDTKAYIRK